MEDKNKGRTKTEIYTRVCGYLRPIQNFNVGKLAEFKERKVFDVSSFAKK